MSKKSWLVLLLIIIVASVLRLWQLGNVPISPDWDEASLGYNAYSLLHTGKDEYSKTFPFVLESFGDYKPALYAYLIIPFIMVFKLSLVAIRLPSALFGIATVIATFFLVKELVKRVDIAMVSSFLLAISPWHIQFSRVAFETNVGLSFNVFAALCFVKGLKRPWMLSLTAIFSCLAIYTYQSEKIFTPLLLVSLVLIYRKELWTISNKYLVAAVVTGLIVILPMGVYILSNPNSLARAKGVSIIGQQTPLIQRYASQKNYDLAHHDYLGLLVDNRYVGYGQEMIGNYLSHFDPNWLFISGDIPRHHPPHMGILYLWELPFILMGMYWLIFGKFDRKTKWFIVAWFLLAPLPAAIATDAPHAVRTLNFLPMYPLFTAVGLIGLFTYLKDKRVRFGVFAIIILLGLFNFAYYLDQYFVQLNYVTSKDWQYGYEQGVPEITAMAGSYKHIIVSDSPPLDQSYIFFLYYLRYDPKQYQSGGGSSTENHAFGKFEFRQINWATEEKSKDYLYVGSPSDFPIKIPADKTVSYVNGESALKIVTP